MEAFDGIPPEVRKPLQDGSSEFLRPLPGAARMYPETDILPIDIEKDTIKKIVYNLPKDPADLREEIRKRSGLSEEALRQISGMDHLSLLDSLTTNPVDGAISTYMITQCFPIVKNKDYSPGGLKNSTYRKLVLSICDGKLAKEALSDALLGMMKLVDKGHNEDDVLVETIEKYGTGPNMLEELNRFIDDLLEKNGNMIRDKGEKSHGPLMGIIMKKYRGKIDGGKISEILKKRLTERIGD